MGQAARSVVCTPVPSVQLQEVEEGRFLVIGSCLSLSSQVTEQHVDETSRNNFLLLVHPFPLRVFQSLDLCHEILCELVPCLIERLVS